MTHTPESASATVRAATLLRELQPWLSRGAALGALLILVSLVAIAPASGLNLTQQVGKAADPVRVYAMLLLVLIAAAAVPPTLHLWRAYRAVHQLGDGDDAALIGAAMGHQAKFWSYVSVLFKVVLSVLGVAVAVVVCFWAIFTLSRSW